MPRGAPRAVAINVGANTNEPGFRGPVYPDGSFAFVPIPEPEPTREPVPTYGALELPFPVPGNLAEVPVHLDPEFPGVHGRDHATYGDPHGVKAGRIADLRRGDWLLFYATLTLRPFDWAGPGDDRGGERLRDRAVDDDLPRRWGAYLIGGFRVDTVVSTPDRETVAERFASNAHLKRREFDARVLVAGDEASRLYDRAVPLSRPDDGTAANRLVTELSSDSGRGPWWRRPMAFDPGATAELLDREPRPE